MAGRTIDRGRRRTGVAAAGLVVTLALAGPALAALAPNFQRAREVGAIAEAVAETATAPIDRIERVGEDRYEVVVGGCVVTAIIRTKTDLEGPPVVGPRRFEVLLAPPRC